MFAFRNRDSDETISACATDTIAFRNPMYWHSARDLRGLAVSPIMETVLPGEL